MRRLTASLLLLAACPALLRAQPAVPPAMVYDAALKRRDAFIRRQVADKKLPALSIALVDDQKVVMRPGDLVITMGAGDVTRCGPELLTALGMAAA